MVFFDFFHHCLMVFSGEIFHLFKHIPKYFIVLDAIANGIICFISSSEILSLGKFEYE